MLRKKPPGRLLSKTAHQIDREYRVIHALEGGGIPVPKAFCLCENAAVIGTPFYIMEYMDGRIFEDPSLPQVPPNDRYLMCVYPALGIANTDIVSGGRRLCER